MWYIYISMQMGHIPSCPIIFAALVEETGYESRQTYKIKSAVPQFILIKLEA